MYLNELIKKKNYIYLYFYSYAKKIYLYILFIYISISSVKFAKDSGINLKSLS